jgi:hypothetical protein
MARHGPQRIEALKRAGQLRYDAHKKLRKGPIISGYGITLCPFGPGFASPQVHTNCRPD